MTAAAALVVEAAAAGQLARLALSSEAAKSERQKRIDEIQKVIALSKAVKERAESKNPPQHQPQLQGGLQPSTSYSIQGSVSTQPPPQSPSQNPSQIPESASYSGGSRSLGIPSAGDAHGKGPTGGAAPSHPLEPSQEIPLTMMMPRVGQKRSIAASQALNTRSTGVAGGRLSLLSAPSPPSAPSFSGAAGLRQLPSSGMVPGGVLIESASAADALWTSSGVRTLPQPAAQAPGLSLDNGWAASTAQPLQPWPLYGQQPQFSQPLYGHRTQSSQPMNDQQLHYGQMSLYGQQPQNWQQHQYALQTQQSGQLYPTLPQQLGPGPAEWGGIQPHRHSLTTSWTMPLDNTSSSSAELADMVNSAYAISIQGHGVDPARSPGLQAAVRGDSAAAAGRSGGAVDFGVRDVPVGDPLHRGSVPLELAEAEHEKLLGRKRFRGMDASLVGSTLGSPYVFFSGWPSSGPETLRQGDQQGGGCTSGGADLELNLVDRNSCEHRTESAKASPTSSSDLPTDLGIGQAEAKVKALMEACDKLEKASQIFHTPCLCWLPVNCHLILPKAPPTLYPLPSILTSSSSSPSSSLRRTQPCAPRSTCAALAFPWSMISCSNW